MGIKTNNIVILGADKRLSTYKNKKISDDNDKILVVNNHLAMTCAGNAAIQKAIETDIDKLNTNKELIFVEDVLELIENLYSNLKKAKVNCMLSRSSYVIIGGLNRKREMKLISVSFVDGKLHWNEIVEDKMIYPPCDVSMKKTAEIFVKNFATYPEMVIEKTVADISKISAVVSKNGNKWIYDNRSKMSEKKYFDNKSLLGYVIKKRLGGLQQLIKQK